MTRQAGRNGYTENTGNERLRTEIQIGDDKAYVCVCVCKVFSLTFGKNIWAENKKNAGTRGFVMKIRILFVFFEHDRPYTREY